MTDDGRGGTAWAARQVIFFVSCLSRTARCVTATVKGMAYTQDLVSAARRHFRAGTELHHVSSAGSQPGCKAVAGYLFGMAGELAVKAMMASSGLAPLPVAQRKDDPFYAHFPELKRLLALRLEGRRSEALRRVAESPNVFQNWDVAMRYAPTADILPAWIDNWNRSAQDLIAQMDLP